MPGHGRLRQAGEGCDHLSCLTFTILQELEYLATGWVRHSREDCVTPAFAASLQDAQDQEDFEGSWLMEKRFPSGSEKVAESPQAYSSG
jgi:hypothetical protein